jgi:hypothetical protein
MRRNCVRGSEAWLDLHVEIASFIIACLSALAALLASWYARGQKKIAERATLASEAASVEARRSADAAVEVAEIERQRRAEEVAHDERDRIRFELVHGDKAKYFVQQSGSEPAFDVRIESEEFGPMRIALPQLGAGQRRQIFVEKSAGTSADAHILVTWHEHPDLSDPVRSQKLYP